MADESTELLKELEVRLHVAERLVTENKANISTLNATTKTKIIDLNKKLADVVLESLGIQFKQQKTNRELKTSLDLMIIKSKKLEDESKRLVEEENGNENLEKFLKKLEDQQRVFEEHVRKYEMMRKELRGRFGTLGAI